MDKNFCFLFLLFFFSLKNFSQDAFVSNNHQALVNLNPSFAGSNGRIRYQSTYRDQFAKPNWYYRSIINSLDVYLKPINGGIAFTYFSNDLARAFIQDNCFNLAYAQHFSLLQGKLKIIPSVQLGYVTNKLESWADPWYNSPQSITRHYFDLSSGILVNYKNFYIGTSFFHMNNPGYGYSNYPPHLRYRIHTSYNLHLGEQTLLDFSLKIDRQQSFQTNQFALNTVLFKSIIAGAGIRIDDAYFFNLGYRNNYFTVQALYERISSKLAGYQNDIWEFSASFNLRNKEQRKSLTNFETW